MTDVNTAWIISWADRMYKKYGDPDTQNDWCRKLAYYCGEQGWDSPSDYAISVGLIWLHKGLPKDINEPNKD